MNPSSSESIRRSPQFWGAVVQADGSTQFRVWAPAWNSLVLEVEGRAESRSFNMKRVDGGFFELSLHDCGDGTRYGYRLPNGHLRPDPASRYQPNGVHGWSQVVDPHNFTWHDHLWKGIARRDLLIYELHLGCFTQAGTYLSAIDRLDELVDLGVTAIELMPIAESPGRWNWGYDGVDLFAPRHTYGTPNELRQLIDGAHQRGVAVFLDVVYNHFGPEGNYWREFGPYLSTKHTTPWGDAPNFDEADSQIVRDFVIANVKYWIREYHFDGLRVDALHCMADDSSPHIVTEIGNVIAELRDQSPRELHLIAESNVYDPEVLQSVKEGGHGWDCLWCDDFLHSVFAILKPGDHMSSRQYAPHTDLDLTLQRGFVFQGTLREQRRRVPWEESAGATRIPINSLIYAIQNHDFIGNHPYGRRLHQLTSINAQMAAAALLLMTPAIPMLFMGEEFAAENPFLFFVDFQDERLRTAVEQGRRTEHPQHDWTNVVSALSPEAFERSKCGSADSGDRSLRQWYQQLISLRRKWLDEGVLTHLKMNARWDERGQLAHLKYGQGDDQHYAVIRLHSSGDTPSSVRLTGITQRILEHNCQLEIHGNETHLLIGRHGVAIGSGAITMTMD